MRTMWNILTLCFSLSSLSLGQTAGDFKSIASGSWHSPATWNMWDGSKWNPAIAPPGASSSVYLDSGNVVSLTQNESCRDLNICTSPSSEHLAIGAFTLNVNGKFRAYVGSSPGTSTASLPGTPAWINTSGGGRISVVGVSRNLTVAGEWGANPPGWAMTIELSSGQAVTLNTNFKAGTIIVGSGTLSIPSGDLRADSGAVGTGRVTIASGATLSMGGGAISRTGTASSGFVSSFTLKGRFLLPGTSVVSINASVIDLGGVVEYAGSGPQSFLQRTSGGSGATPNLYQKLIIGGTGQKNLTTTTTVVGDIAFVGNAGIALGPYHLNMGGTFSGTGPGKTCVTSGTGCVRRYLATGDSFQFPVSTNGSDFNPVVVSLIPSHFPTPDTFSVLVKQGVNPAAPNNQSAVQRTWIVTESPSAVNSVSLTLQWNGSQEGTSFKRAAAGIWSYDGSTWIESGSGVTSGTDPYSLTSPTLIHVPGTFIIGNEGALPISLASFTALVRSGVSVEIRWATISEIDNYGFEIERGDQNEGPFIVVSPLIGGNGTTNVPHSYRYVDCNPVPGPSYYRLKQLDLDRSIHYYGPVRVNNRIDHDLDSPQSFSLSQNYPNPFNGVTEIKFSVASIEHATLKAFNAIGQEVATLFQGIASPGQTYTAVFDGSTLPSGVYIVRLVCGSGTVMRKLLQVR